MLIAFYSGKRILITGHTGFKGSWLALWLKKLGATVVGYSKPAPTDPNLYSVVREHAVTEEVIADINDARKLREAVARFQPDIIFHLAAQPLVRRSYVEPVETFATNVIGTINLMEAVRAAKSAAALILITTDKCYENREWDYAYRENDALGGHDTYSASKAAAEIAIQSWRESFFKTNGELGPVASARAGNVIGGGDYAEDRIVPDALRAVLAGRELVMRNPAATRPWQHVLDCLHGYLILAQKLVERGKDSEMASAFNFGPGPHSDFPVKRVVDELFRVLPGKLSTGQQLAGPHEAGKLNLAIDKATTLLDWTPRWHFEEIIRRTAEWYNERHFKKNPDMLEYSLRQIEAFESSSQR
ncbi:MAG TPA: CDP-glucose 4,6-dehydratase [Verrucomicrobiae bacterium]